MIPTTPQVTEIEKLTQSVLFYLRQRYNASQLVGGLWYSTQAAGQCGRGSACTWRVVETIKTINATCANEALFTAVRGKDPACFAHCGTDDFNITSDCFLDCFCAHHTVLTSRPRVPIALVVRQRVDLVL